MGKLSVMEALGYTTQRIMSWASEKLDDKVNKDGNKKLTDENYSLVEKNKVGKMATGLQVLDGKLYLTNDGGIIESTATALPSGGGSGSGSSAAITLINLLESTTLTTSVGGDAVLQFSFESSESNSGTAYIYVGGNLKGTAPLVSGENTINVGPYIGEGTNEVKLTCTDIYSNSKSLSYTVNAISLRVTSTFDDSQIYSGDINVRYIPYGAVEKTMHFVFDDVDTTVTVKETGKQQTQIIPATYHGSHTLKIYATAIVSGEEVKSNELLFDIVYVEDGVTTPMIASAYNVDTIIQGELVNIPFLVYDPSNLETEITLEIKHNDEVYSSVNRIVGRTKEMWSTRDVPVGIVTFVITYGVISKIHTITVTENNIDVAVKESDLEFQLRAAGKSNDDKDKDTWVSGDVTTTFEYVNWESTGWVQDDDGDTALRLSGDAKATINFMPFKSDARETGRTIEMEFAIRDVNNRDAVAISCLSGGIGFTVTADTATLTSELTTISCNYTDEEKIRVAFVIEPRSEYRMMSVYLNGVLSGVKQYPETDNMQQNPTVNITVGSPYCSVDLYTIRSYNTALITTEVRDNYIADITDVGEKLSLYEDNNIYDDFGSLSFSALKDKIPVLVITGTLPVTKGNKRNVTVTYTDPLNPSLNFEDSATIDVQGTSSAGYVRKNWKIKTSSPHILDLNQVETKVLCWKVDYAEATGTHNTGNANYVHTLYGDVKTPPQENDERVRTTIYGRPCVIFHKADSSAEPVFYGKSNANIDKGGEEVFGFTSDYPDAQCVEFCNNDAAACKFQGPIPDDWGDEFEFRYPDGHEDISAFRVMHNWVVSTWQDGATGDALPEVYTGVDGKTYDNDTAEYRLAKFKKEFTEYFDFEFMLIYYLYTFVILMVDQRAKNMFLTTWDKKHWQAWLYDNDTCLGINNVGELVFDYYHEDHDTDGEKYIYNGAESALWANFREAFPGEIQELYAEWRNHEGTPEELVSYETVKGLLSYDKIIEYFITRQSDKWCISVYNEDADFKYISMLRSDNNARYLFQVRGTGEEHLKYFAKNRLMYCDSKWNAGYYPDDRVILRLYSPAGELAVPANHSITVTPYSNIYAGVKYNANGTLQQQRAEKNVPVTFRPSADSEFGDTDTYIYGASEMSSIGDLSPMYCGYVDVSKATKLTELIVGSGVEGYSNTNLKTVAVGTNKLLKKIDVRNCPSLTDPLSLANCPNIQEVYATGSGITGIELPRSGYLKKVHLPGTLTNLTVTNQQYIEEFTLEGYSNLTTLRIEDTVNIPVEDIMLNAPNLNRIRLIDVQWETESEAALVQTITKFKSCLGLDENGNNTNSSVVTGRVKVHEKVSTEVIGDIYNSFPDLVVDDGSDELYIVNYKDWDGTILYTARLAEGADAIDPIAIGAITAPFRASDANYSYEFIGWSTLPTNVSRHYQVVAQYKTLVAVNFAANGQILHTEYVQYGTDAEDPVANGTIDAPTKEGTDDLHYVFDSWDGSLLNITLPRTLNATFANVFPVRFYATETSSTPHYVQWVKDGDDAHDPVAAGECTTPADIVTANVKTLVFSAWDNIPTSVTAICQVYAQYNTHWAAVFKNEYRQDQWQTHHVIYIPEGESVPQPDCETPTKVSTDQYDFTFWYWDGNFEAITEPREYRSIYRESIRHYNVYFYLRRGTTEEPIQIRENVPYGSKVTCSISAKELVNMYTDTPEDYDFKGWSPSPDYITGETHCYALFKFKGYLFGRLDEGSEYGTTDNPNWEKINAHWSNIYNDVNAYKSGDMSQADFEAKYIIGARMLIPVELPDGSSVADVEIIGRSHDNLADGSGKATLTFFSAELLDIEKAMFDGTYDSGGWRESDLRAFLNDELYVNGLPEQLHNIISPVIKISDGGADDKTLVETTDYCWCASMDEINFTGLRNVLYGQGEPYDQVFKNDSDRVKIIVNTNEEWGWRVRSYAYGGSRGFFHRITKSGGTYPESPQNPYPIAFGFCI